jgi:phosphatidylglycerophosphate synthase
MNERKTTHEFVPDPAWMVGMTGFTTVSHTVLHEFAQGIQHKAMGEAQAGEIATIASISLAMGALAGAAYLTLCDKGICNYNELTHLRWNLIGATGLNMVVAVSELSSALHSALQS